jgi:hypothetical protein
MAINRDEICRQKRPSAGPGGPHRARFKDTAARSRTGSVGDQPGPTRGRHGSKRGYVGEPGNAVVEVMLTIRRPQRRVALAPVMPALAGGL